MVGMEKESMSVRIGASMETRLIARYDERTWRTQVGNYVERVPVPELLEGERMKEIAGGWQILRKGEF